MYLNPKERARRDLEDKHGNNVVKLAQASQDRMHNTLETQLKKLGVSIGGILSPIKSQTDLKGSFKLPPSGKKTLTKTKTAQPGAFEATFSRIEEGSDDQYSTISPTLNAEL